MQKILEELFEFEKTNEIVEGGEIQEKIIFDLNKNNSTYTEQFPITIISIYREAAKAHLLTLQELEALNSSFFPKEYTINIGYEENIDDRKHIVKRNPGGIADFDEYRYLLFMIEDKKYILVDGSDRADTWYIVENIEEMEKYLKEDGQ